MSPARARARVARVAVACSSLVLGACAAIAGLGDEPTSEVGSAADANGDVLVDAGADGDASPIEATTSGCVPLPLGSHRPGDVDETFGNHGMAVHAGRQVTPVENARVAVDHVGRIVIATTEVEPITTTDYVNHGAVVGFTTDGAPDPRFGDGMILLDPAGESSAGGVAVDPDDGIAIAGGTGHTGTSGVVHRLAADGGPVGTFGTDGSVSGARYDGAASVFYDELTLLPDRSMVVAGQIFGDSGAGGFLLARYLSSGFPVRIGGQLGERSGFVGGGMWVRGLAATPDEAIIVVGSPQSSPVFGLIRYTWDGGLDTTFGLGSALGGGDAASPAPDGGGVNLSWPGAPVIGSDGSVTLAGEMPVADDSGVAGHYHVAVARVRADGALDPSFGVGGVVQVPIGQYHSEASAVAQDPDGRHVVVAGFTADATFDGSSTFTSGTVVLVRLDAAGNLDPTFGDGGIAVGPLHPTTSDGLTLFNAVPSGLAWDTCRQRWIVAARAKFTPALDIFPVAFAFHGSPT